MPSSISNKPSKLNDREFIAVKQHPDAEAEILRKNGAEPEVIDIVLHHHEKVNDSGFLDLLRGEEISLFG